jgi:hypothetical protein
MRMQGRLSRVNRVLPTMVLVGALFAVPIQGQTDKYTARLAWVPIANVAQQPLVGGKGSVTATLTGTKLAVTGTFEGLPAPATVARLHKGVVKGARGPSFADLTITKAPSGTISGSVALTADQVESLKEGKLYVQVHSEKGVDDGSALWGWLLK